MAYYTNCAFGRGFERRLVNSKTLLVCCVFLHAAVVPVEFFSCARGFRAPASHCSLEITYPTEYNFRNRVETLKLAFRLVPEAGLCGSYGLDLSAGCGHHKTYPSPQIYLLNQS